MQIPPDIHDIPGAACGHGALAAALDTTVARAMTALGKDGWINIPMMKQGIRALGHTFRQHTIPDAESRQRSIVLINWKGPWSNNPREQVRHRHWLAIRDMLIFDTITLKWLPQSEYDKALLDYLPENITGYTVATFLSITSP